MTNESLMEKKRGHSNDHIDAQLHVFSAFRTFADFNFMGQTINKLFYYSLSHKVEISERSKTPKNVQLSINVLISMTTFSPLSFHSSIFFYMF